MKKGSDFAMSEAEVNIHALDAAYKPFPTFAEWAAKTSIDTVRWERYKGELENRPNSSSDSLKRAYEVVKRAAALDTGAIEGLYEVDRGFTFTVAFETAAWEVELAKKGENVRPLFEAQLHAYDYVLDFATKAEPISEAAIRKLHEVVCGAQETYRVMTSIGPQEQKLVKGRYKVLPNHVRTRDGVDHSYAPVDVTPPEMARLVSEMRIQAFLAAHPVIQAAYAHYALVVIHPFADGNGRVARALASAFTYRAISMPIMILSEHKETYLDALEAADMGQYQVFADFLFRRSINTMTLVGDTIRRSSFPSAAESLAAINDASVHKGRFSDQQVDEGGVRLMNLLDAEVRKELSKVEIGKVQGKTGMAAGGHQGYFSDHRPAQNVGHHLSVELLSIQPSRLPQVSMPPAVVTRQYDLFVPRDANPGDEYLVRDRKGTDQFAVPVDDVLPALSGTLQIRAELFAERVVAELLANLKSEVDRVNQRLQ
jgi:Fic family protein